MTMLVIGATGKVGGYAVDGLRRQGADVRVYVRNPVKARERFARADGAPGRPARPGRSARRPRCPGGAVTPHWTRPPGGMPSGTPRCAGGIHHRDHRPG